MSPDLAGSTLDDLHYSEKGLEIEKTYQTNLDFCTVKVGLTVAAKEGNYISTRVFERIPDAITPDDIDHVPEQSTYEPGEKWNHDDGCDYFFIMDELEPGESVHQVFTYTISDEDVDDRFIDQVSGKPDIRIGIDNIPDSNNPVDTESPEADSASGPGEPDPTDSPDNADGEEPPWTSENGPPDSGDEVTISPEEATDDPFDSILEDQSAGEDPETADGDAPAADAEIPSPELEADDITPDQSTEPASETATDEASTPEEGAEHPLPATTAGEDTTITDALLAELASDNIPDEKRHQLARHLQPHLDDPVKTKRIDQLESRVSELEAIKDTIVELEQRRGDINTMLDMLDGLEDRISRVEADQTEIEETVDELRDVLQNLRNIIDVAADD